MPALKRSYDLKKLKRQQRTNRANARAKMKLKQEPFTIRTESTSLSDFGISTAKKTKKAKKKFDGRDQEMKNYPESCGSCKYFGRCPSEDCRRAQILAKKYGEKLHTSIKT